MIIYKYRIYITLIISLFINFNQSQSLNSEDYSCMLTIASQCKSTNKFSFLANSTTTYDWCGNGGNNGMVKCSSNSIIKLSFSTSNMGLTSYVFTPSYFSCFSSIESITFSSTKISSGFLSNLPTNLQNAVVNFQNTNYTIDSSTSPIKQLFITFPSDSSQSTINLSHIINIKSFSCFTKMVYVNDLSNSDNNYLTNLTITVNSLPLLRFFDNIQNLFVYSDSSFSTISLTSYYTFLRGDVVINISNGETNCMDFPISPITLNSNVNSLTFNGLCFNAVLTNIIDLSSLNLSSLSIINPGLNFSYQSNSISYFPFTNFPRSFSILFTGGYINSFININGLELINSMILTNNSISQNLIANTFTNTKTLILDNNLIGGSVDESWCSTLLNVSTNKMVGYIPTCYSCYLSDPLIYYSFNNNNFLNLDPPPTTCDIKLSLVNGFQDISNSGNITISGKYLPYYSSQIQSTPSIDWNILKPSSIIQGTLLNPSKFKTMNITFIQKYQFTISLVDQSPIVKNATYDSIKNQIIINGSYFSNNPNDSIVLISTTETGITTTLPILSSTFYSIIVNVSGSLPSSIYLSLQVGNYQSQKFLISTLQSSINIGCTLTCSSNGFCDMSKGECVYCKSNSECNGVGTCSSGICICPLEYTGDKCQIPNQYVNQIVPSTINGGLVILNGFFGNSHDNLSIIIGTSYCKLISVNETSIQCNATSGNGIKTIFVIQNNITWTGLNQYQYQTIVKDCPNQCISNSQGICNTETGLCQCIQPYSGFDCSVKVDQSAQNNTQISVNQTQGSAQIDNQNVKYDISILSIHEMDINGKSIKEYKLDGKWVYNSITSNDTFSIFSQTVNGSQILSTIEEVIDNDKQFEFAGIQFTVNKGSVKVTLSISNWLYDSTLNTLQIRMKSSSSDISTDECQGDTSINTINQNENIGYITINKNGKTLFGRFLDRVLSDSKPTFTQNSIVEKDQSSVIIGINLPHCVTECKLDPDWWVLVSSDINQSSCNSKNKWLIPVVVVVPVVGLTAIIIVSVVLYKRYRTSIKVKLNSLKLSKL